MQSVAILTLVTAKFIKLRAPCGWRGFNFHYSVILAIYLLSIGFVFCCQIVTNGWRFQPSTECRLSIWLCLCFYAGAKMFAYLFSRREGSPNGDDRGWRRQNLTIPSPYLLDGWSTVIVPRILHYRRRGIQKTQRARSLGSSGDCQIGPAFKCSHTLHRL